MTIRTSDTRRFAIRARPARGDAGALRIVRDLDLLAPHLEDAAHFPGGSATELVAPTTEAEVAEALRSATAVLPIGAQSSLTGGATPFGERLLSTARMRRIERIGAEFVRVGPGVTIAALDEALAQAGLYYPPGPTFTGAFIGGTVATNAAGAATFKYGATRNWVEGLTVVLPTGDVLDLERGAVQAHPDGFFELELAAGLVRVPLPTYPMPKVAKLSAGYFAAPEMDLIDLFIGSEGTLGVVTSITLRVLPRRPAFCLALVPFRDRRRALSLVRHLRETAIGTWRAHDDRGVDVSAIEHMDARSLALVREDRIDTLTGVSLGADVATALLVVLELSSETTAGLAFEQIGRAQDADAPDTPLVRFCRMLGAAGVLDEVEIAVPGDERRGAQLLALREAVPAAVNTRIGRAQRVDPSIQKMGADVIVPVGHIDELLDFCDAQFRHRGLDAAVWGHISDGNIHPNVLSRSADEVVAAREAVLAIGREAIRLGGAPLAEHGVGRNPVKQLLLRELYGEQGVEEMRRVKRAIDPEWKLAPGVLFQR